MTAFDLLDDKIKKYIWNQKWASFRPIQETAIQHILQTDHNYILAAKTASGKTEAAFLPAINSITKWDGSVKILYISPLIALINDQFLRIEKLSEYLDVKVTKWHGEASRSEKQKLIKRPEGILLITPESIEAMYVNHSENIKTLFSQLEYVIIDEIHSFLGTSRGKHLQSLLSRLQNVNANKYRLLGLSATLSKESYVLAKEFIDNGKDTKVIVDSDKNKISVSMKYTPSETAMLSDEMINDLYEKTQTRKSLIFPNTRGRVEEIAVRLKKLSGKRYGKHNNYFAHHSSVDRELREFVERFAKTSFTQNFAISCTSTLELGIDIGSIDTVIQVDSTFSVASLVQRLGRSGRKTGESNLLLYATNEWSLLQSIACIELYKDGFIEPLRDITFAYDVLLQQILSIVKEHTGITVSILKQVLRKDVAFKAISDSKINDLLKFLLEQEIIEKIQDELIIGIEGEKIVNSRDFYSLFDSEDNYVVEFKGSRVGELPLSPQLIPNENVFLAAKIWKIQEINSESKRIYVIPAKDGKKPKFFGYGGEIHNRVREKMFEIIRGVQSFTYLDSSAIECLQVLRKKFSILNEKPGIYRPIFIKGDKSLWYTFTGTRINRTLDLLFKMKGHTNILFTDSETSFTTTDNLEQVVLEARNTDYNQINEYLMSVLDQPENTIPLGKFTKLLPLEIQADYLIKNYYDIDDTNKFIQMVQL